MEYLFIYLLQVAEYLHRVSVGLVVISPFVWIIHCILEAGVQESVFEKKYLKIPLIMFFIGIFLYFIPTKQTLLLMGGTYLGKKAVNAVVTDEKIKKVDTIINLQLDKYIKELQANN